MFIDLNDVGSDHFEQKRFDVAICGAGVAGITLARKLSAEYSVALCEAGDIEYSQESQEQYDGQISGDEYFPLDATRLRFFGGTSNHWGGWCRPLDAHDFEAKAQNPDSGWPISKSDLDPYAQETRQILDLAGDVSDSCPQGPQFDFAGFEQIQFSWSAPTRFNKKYRDEIANSSNISCYLNANVVDLSLADDSDRIDGMEISDYANRRFSVRARVYIIAAGGLENPRILLNCNRQIDTGIGNQHDLVGRFFSEHLHYNIGRFILEDGQRQQIGLPGRTPYSCFYGPTADLLQDEQILNFGLRIQLFRDDLDGAFKHKVKEVICSAEWTQDFINLFRDRDMACTVLVDGQIKLASEQALNRESRVMLGDDRDSFGSQKIDLRWQRSPVDKKTLLRGGVRFAEEFAINRVGRMQIADWLLQEEADYPDLASEETGGHHHMCTTRMASRAQEGVVDKDLAVFGTENLFITGSSVFSTAGHANPTFTIVQLTLRLAEHLNSSI
jgi:choline dehydrogenase-like flavoprotein